MKWLKNGKKVAAASLQDFQQETKRIERLWRDIFRCVIHMFYYIFYALEKEQLIDIENPIDMSALRLMSS